MDDGASPFDVGYLAGAFEPSRLQELSSRLSDVLRNAKVDVAASGTMLPARGSNRDDMIEACNTVLDPIGIELRELEPRRFGLRTPQIEGDDDGERQERNDPASLDAALLASWLLRFGHVESLHIQTPNNLPPFFAGVLRATLPFCSKKLRALKLRGYGFFSEGFVEDVLHGAASTEALQSLQLMYVQLTDMATKSLASLLQASSQTITHLSFGPDSISGAGAITACIKQCSKLKDLDLWCFPPNDEEGLEFFEEYIKVTDTLERLSMMNVAQNILARLLKALSANKTVKTAKFIVGGEKCSDVFDEVVSVLRNNTVLRKLKLNGLEAESSECMARVFEAVKVNVTLESFTIGIVDPVAEENGGELALSSLLEAIEANKALRSLCLQGGIMSNKTLRRIAKSLTANPTLKILRIFPPSLEDKEDTEGFWEDVRDSCNRLDVQWWNSAGLNQLALALPQSKVDKLFLNWTFGMWNPPLVEVMRGLQANQTITRLHLHNIDCYDDADMEALAEYVSKTKVLKKLTMIYEILYPEVGIPLIDALGENTSINCVDFGKFDMDLEACKHFGAMLAKNRTLHWLRQSEEYASPDALALVAEGMEQNCTLLQLDLAFKPPSPALSRIARAVAANERRLNRAVDFVLDTAEQGEISVCEEAFRLLCQKDSLVDQLIKMTGQPAANVLSLIESAKGKLMRSVSGK
ncbi:uncharacterized protein LOC144164439 [Haemaphysalis longicornis]